MRDGATELAVPALAGRYVHLRELGSGASGRVLLVEDRADGGTWAVKIVSPAEGERLGWERVLLGSLAHPGLARVHELLRVPSRLGPPWSLDAGSVVLVEEHVDGPSAGEAAAALDDDDARVRFAVSVGGAVARALGAIHAAGLVHCDVKPANVVVPDDPSCARLVDLGLTRPAGISPTLSGTLGYLAPEALLGERTVATDLFALGAMLHALLLGRTAFDTTASELSLADALARRPRVEELPAAVPLALRRLVGDLLAERADERPDGAREVALRLRVIAIELGIDAEADDAGLSAAPLGVERAARAGVRPLVGRDLETRAIVDHLRAPGVIAVVGPAGAGRSRAIRESVRVSQTRSARTRGRAPTYLATGAEAPSRLAHDALVHLEGASVDWDAVRCAVEAADVDGFELSVIAEVGEGAFVPDDVPCVTLGPLADESLRILLAELLEVDPASALIAAARAASAGLPGRLCRLVAEGFEAGLDPSRPATLEELGRRHEDATVVPDAARPLADLLALAGGALRAEPASALVPEAEGMARALLAAGLAYLDPEGRVALRQDVRRALRRAMPASLVREAAARLEGHGVVGIARAHVLAALGRHAEASAIFLKELEACRAAGDPDAAAALGLEALDVLELPPLALRLATADALRARARETAALTVLGGLREPEAVAARAELARLLGDAERALTEAEAASGDVGATIVRARLAAARGAQGEALTILEGLEVSDPVDRARCLEIRVFAALSEGALDTAALHARDALVGLRESADRRSLARASSVEGTVLWARGRVDDAAARFERAFELAEAAGERYAAASYLVNVGLGRLERGAAGPAIEALREGARRLTALGRRRDATRALYNLGNAAALVGDDELARSAVRRAAEWAKGEGDRHAEVLAAVVDADLAMRAGKLDAAMRAVEEAWRDVPDALRMTVGARRAVTHAVRGDIERAEAALEAIGDVSADRSGEAERAIARTRVALARSDAEAAAREATEALARAEAAGWETRLRASLCAAEAFERAGRGLEARAMLARARRLIDSAAAGLGAHARARLRAVPAYRRALAVEPLAAENRAAPARTDDDRWRVLVRHAKGLVREPRLDRLYEAIVDAAVEIADAERGFLVTRVSDGSLRSLASRAFGADLRDGRPSTSVATRVLDGGRALVTVDAIQDDRLDAAASVHAMALRSVLAVPLPLGDRSAALLLDDRLRPAAFDDVVVELVSDLAELAAGAIERSEALRAERREGRRLVRDKERLSARVESAEEELSELRRRGSNGPAFEGIVAESEPMRRALRLVERVASSDVPVLVRGESGTGKELVARALHDASARRAGPYVSENCSAIPESLLESTLFGHVKGAFTGAERARRGLFEIADGGTLFLDEIGEMGEAMQAKLLRVLSDGQVRPVGSEHVRQVDVRVVAATHRDIPRLVEEGRFREDLFYRIAVVQVELPSLRARPDDVLPLVTAFLERHASERDVRIDAAAMSALRTYAWPGNVRELENEIRRALILADERIGLAHLSPPVQGDAEADRVEELDLKGQVNMLERRLIRRALERTGGNQTRAALLLGLSRYGLQKMMKRLGVTKNG